MRYLLFPVAIILAFGWSSDVYGANLFDKLKEELQKLEGKSQSGKSVDPATDEQEQSQSVEKISEPSPSRQARMGLAECPSLYGFSLGMPADQALQNFLERYPEATQKGPTSFGVNLGEKNGHRKMYFGKAYSSRPLPCFSAPPAWNGGGQCVMEMDFLVEEGNQEAHGAKVSFYEDFPQQPGLTRIDSIRFQHRLGNTVGDKPPQQLFDEKFGHLKTKKGYFCMGKDGEAQVHFLHKRNSYGYEVTLAYGSSSPRYKASKAMKAAEQEARQQTATERSNPM